MAEMNMLSRKNWAVILDLLTSHMLLCNTLEMSFAFKAGRHEQWPNQLHKLMEGSDSISLIRGLGEDDLVSSQTLERLEHDYYHHIVYRFLSLTG